MRGLCDDDVKKDTEVGGGVNSVLQQSDDVSELKCVRGDVTGLQYVWILENRDLIMMSGDRELIMMMVEPWLVMVMGGNIWLLTIPNQWRHRSKNTFVGDEK